MKNKIITISLLILATVFATSAQTSDTSTVDTTVIDSVKKIDSTDSLSKDTTTNKKNDSKVNAIAVDSLHENDSINLKDSTQHTDSLSEISYGKLNITTVPESVTVIFDDVEKGLTPIKIDSIVSGKHTIVLKRAGYFVKKVSVNTKSNTDSKLEFSLIKPVTLIVNSTPENAVVSLNGKVKGKTPFVTKTLKPKEYNLSLKLDSSATVDTTILLKNGSSDSLFFNLGVTSDKSDSSVAVSKEVEKDKRVKKILNFASIGIFAVFTAIVLLIELSHN